MILHIANKNYSSWSLRPWLLMSALGIDFQERLHPFGGPSFLTFSPSGTVPCLHDGDHVIWDSLAIAEYVAEAHPRVWPRNAAARAWARSAAAEMHSGFAALREQCSMTIGQRIRLHQISPELARDLHRLEDLLTSGLMRFDGPWLAGASFTAADSFFAPVAFRWQTYHLDVSSTVTSYFERLLSHPHMKAWEVSALAETLRDAPHDRMVTQWGTCVDDLRAPCDI